MKIYFKDKMLNENIEIIGGNNQAHFLEAQMAELKETYTWNLKSKYETLLKQLQKIDDAILEADLSTTQIKDLFTIKQSLVFQLESLEKLIMLDS